jgi:hypothetical protein
MGMSEVVFGEYGLYAGELSCWLTCLLDMIVIRT